MKGISGLKNAPMFSPIVSNFYSGMAVTVPLFASQVNASAEELKKLYSEKYHGEIVKYVESADENGFLSGGALSGKDCMRITVAGNAERILLLAVYDNLGKGASGAAIECMNLAIGENRTKGLIL